MKKIISALLTLFAFSSVSFAADPVAVPTFESIGLYWAGVSAPLNADEIDCQVAFRAKGTATWSQGLPLWYDARNTEYRGSLVHLKSGTTYEIKLTLDDGTTQTMEATTWTENFPIAQTITLPETSDQTLNITQSGTPNGYILYTAEPGKTATIDVNKLANFNVIINAKYIIVRGLTLKGAKHSGILIGPSASSNTADLSDIIIEDNDISAWGSKDPKCTGTQDFGANLQAGVYSYSTKLKRVVIQRNKLHHPSTDANSWDEVNCSGTGSKHPQGPQGITIAGSQGNLVIRYNEIYSDSTHYFNDGMGEVSNFSDGGFPNKDSDINGNIIRNSWDDGIESEGADKNVRIWGNYIDQTYIKIALASVYRGPIYIWKNLSHISRSGPTSSYGQAFFKIRNHSTYYGGRVYVFNNTSLKPKSGSGTANFMSEYDAANKITNYRTLNNIMAVSEPTKKFSIKDSSGDSNIFNYDLLGGLTSFTNIPVLQEPSGVKGSPVYVTDWGLDEVSRKGKFSLASTSRGFDQGTVIPNFMDTYSGAAPDMGAHESDTPPMEFGTDAYKNLPQTLFSVADTYLMQTGASHGAEACVLVKKGNATYNRQGYIKFDTTGITKPLTSAKLRLTLQPTPGFNEAGTVVVREFKNDEWDESTTWATRPSDTNMAATLASVVVPVPAANVLEVDVTNFVNERISAGSSKVSFTLRSLTGNNSGACVSTRETTFAPQLVIAP